MDTYSSVEIRETPEDSGPIRWGVVVFISLVAVIGILGPKLLWMIEGYRELVWSLPIDVQFLVHPVLRMLLALVAWLVLLRMRDDDDRATMGLGTGASRAIKGLVIGFGCTLPMLGLGLMSDSFTFSRYEVMYKSIAPGITEEIFYRALMFGLLVQIARTPMIWTAIITGIVFGLAHVDITPDEGETILGQLNLWNAMIGLGGFMYAWLYFESRWNLWLVIALHIGMNLWWGMFAMSSTPLGGWGATLSRIVSVGLVVFIVVGLRVFGPKPGATIGHDRTSELT